MIANVLVEIRKLDKTFSYQIPKGMEVQIGCRVLVPFGKQQLEGFVVDIISQVDFEVKPIIELIDETPVLNDELLKLGLIMQKRLMTNLINCYQSMLPSALKANKNHTTSIKKQLYIKLNDLEYKPNTESEIKIINLLKTEQPKAKLKEISVYTTNKLIANNVLIQYEKEVYRTQDYIEENTSDLNLTDDQQKIIERIKPEYKPYLLHGVTGSGKTEIYIKLIKETIKNNKKAIVLVPEISLTPQFLKRFQARFGNKIAIFHSKLNNGERYDEWRKIKKNEVDIVIGTRSAIFTPFENVGVIILDEEHSPTYKQENDPFYNAIDIALIRAKYHNCPLILGSATPSLESYTRANLNYYDLLEITKRVNNMLPEITIVNMKDEFKKRNFIFSQLLTEKINQKLQNNEQIMLLLNRRGYKTIVTCPSCGFIYKCPDCDIPLTYHLNKNKMLCHYCNHTNYKSVKCPECHSDLNERGMGTEMLEEEVKKQFPEAKVIRMDYDTTKTKKSHQKIIEDFENKKFNILIGTQMIAKGLDFKDVTLVGVLNGDNSLFMPDYKSSERTFQLLYQVAGRSGRSQKKGDVIIQCFNDEHYSLQCVKEYDYKKFYEKELEMRKILKYPPFYNLSQIKISGLDEKQCEIEGKKIADYLKTTVKDVVVLGPSISLLPKINKMNHYQITIKYKNSESLIKALQFVKKMYLNNTKIKVAININT